MKKTSFILMIFLLASCTANPLVAATPATTSAPPYRINPDENPYAPQLDDVGREVASVTIMSVSLAEKYEFTPPRSMLTLTGYMPSVCNELRVDINPPDENYNVKVEVYSLIKKDVQCDDVFQQFEASILLGEYSPGRYQIYINGALAGDFVSY